MILKEQELSDLFRKLVDRVWEDAFLIKVDIDEESMLFGLVEDGKRPEIQIKIQFAGEAIELSKYDKQIWIDSHTLDLNDIKGRGRKDWEELPYTLNSKMRVNRVFRAIIKAIKNGFEVEL